MATTHDEWNDEKKSIDSQDRADLFIKQRQIWIVKMGKNIGFEEDGKSRFTRPVVVLKKVGSLYFTVALTSVNHANQRYYLPLKESSYVGEKFKTNHSLAILSQVKVMDSKRFVRKIGNVSKRDHETLKEKLKALLL